MGSEHWELHESRHGWEKDRQGDGHGGAAIRTDTISGTSYLHSQAYIPVLTAPYKPRGQSDS